MRAEVRIFLERLLAGTTAVLGAVTIFWRDWIEGVFGWDPDHHSGAAEIGIILGIFAISVIFFLVSRTEQRRLSIARSAAS